MTPRRRKNLRQPRSRERLQVTHPHAAGIDIHAGKHWVAVPAESAPPPVLIILPIYLPTCVALRPAQPT
jgi:hypothetical protein